MARFYIEGIKNLLDSHRALALTLSNLMRYTIIPGLVVIPCALYGCGPPAPQVDEAELNLRRIVQAYFLHINKAGRAPADVEAIKQQFKGLGDQRDADVILRSPRDGQPYVILYGNPMDATKKEILAYERDGKDGKRYVVMMSHDILVLTDEEFKNAPFAGGHRPTLAQ